MSLLVLEKLAFIEQRQESFLPSQIETCPEELFPAVTLVERFAADLLEKVGKAVNSVKLKLLIPVKTYSTGYFLWRHSYVLTDDLSKLEIDVSRFAVVRIAEGAAVSVEELEKHHIEVTKDYGYAAKWYPSSRTIKISTNVLHEAFQFLLFELTNASFNKEIRAISTHPKHQQVEEYERLEFGTTKAVRERLEEMPFCKNLFHYTHRDFRLHYLHQELRGHVALLAKHVRTEVGSAWPYSMEAEERAQFGKIIDFHILSLYGPENEKKLYETKLQDLTKNLTGNLQKNWAWYLALYENITSEESTDVS